MDEKTTAQIIILIDCVLSRPSPRGPGKVSAMDSAKAAAKSLAKMINYHVISNVNCYSKIGGRQIPAIKRVCSCGWESEPYTSIKEAMQESNMHEVVNSINYEVD